jgi:hypothetical protein
MNDKININESDTQFEIRILDLHWIKEDEPDDGKDLCLHGRVFIKIGDEVLSDKESGSWTVSSTGLYLLRTLTTDYQPDDFCSQLLPCCGHFIVAEDNKPVEIFGCPNGVDWTIKHIRGKGVKHISANGSEAMISEEDYRNIVFDFADKVEDFYRNALPRQATIDGFTDIGYAAFWQEWKMLKI